MTTMKYKLTRFAFLILFPLTVAGQGKSEMEWTKIGKADSIQLSKTWTTFLTALENGDDKTIKRMSLDKISCDLCKDIDATYSTADDLIPIDTFVNQTNRSFLNSQLYKAIKKRGVRYSILIIPNFRPSNVPKSASENLQLFEIWVITYVADEWAKGHEGQSHAFQFIKTGDGFRYYGLTSVP
jgi:hypothetical protein